MEPAQAFRQMAVELSREGAAAGVPQVGGHPLHVHWFLLVSHFREVLLVPQRRVGDSGTTWTWREPREARPLSSSECEELRHRLQAGARSLEDAADMSHPSDPGRQAVLLELAETMSGVIGRLTALPDHQLAAYACRTEAGIFLHSWGARRPELPHATTAPPLTADEPVAEHTRLRSQARASAAATNKRRTRWAVLLLVLILVGAAILRWQFWPGAAVNDPLVLSAEAVEPPVFASSAVAGAEVVSAPAPRAGGASLGSHDGSPAKADGVGLPGRLPPSGGETLDHSLAGAGGLQADASKTAITGDRSAAPAEVGARVGASRSGRNPPATGALAESSDARDGAAEIAAPEAPFPGVAPAVPTEADESTDGGSNSTNRGPASSPPATLQQGAPAPPDARPLHAEAPPSPAAAPAPATPPPPPPDHRRTVPSTSGDAPEGADTGWQQVAASVSEPGRQLARSPTEAETEVARTRLSDESGDTDRLPSPADPDSGGSSDGASKPTVADPNQPDATLEPETLWSHGLALQTTPWLARRLQDAILPTQPVRIGTPDTVRYLRVRVREALDRENPWTISAVVARSGITVAALRRGVGEEDARELELGDRPITAFSPTGDPLARVAPAPAGGATLQWNGDSVIRWWIEIDVPGLPLADQDNLQWHVRPAGEAVVIRQSLRVAAGRHRLELPLHSEGAVSGSLEISLVDSGTGWAWTSGLSIHAD